MALSLANMLARVKRNVPTTTMDTELQDVLLERMNYLQSLEVFPFTESYVDTVLAVGDWRCNTPNNFAILKDAVIWNTDHQYDIEILDKSTFSKLFPKPDEEEARSPGCCCVNVAEDEIWFDCPMDIAYTIRIVFNAIPDDATSVTITQLTELAKICLIKWASADGFRMIGEHDRADQFEKQGDNHFLSIKKRYQRAIEEDARFMSPQEFHVLR